ncbi:hypothetical protein RF11_11140 [Thelohanellus kitauei]|uniref:Uncharacterized protein n=1 Tax=Thelohanellus kitauei TaxID=669202 RepID=A0A0C2IJF4_THEKT|nr:hypothetical protein RF11_11140 [Thelohanellus kitauei]
MDVEKNISITDKVAMSIIFRIKQHTLNDPRLNIVKQLLRYGFPNKGSLDPEFNSYYEMRNDISIEEDIQMWQDGLIIPETMKNDIFKHFHSRHPGVAAMKSFIQFNVCGQGMTQYVE